MTDKQSKWIRDFVEETRTRLDALELEMPKKSNKRKPATTKVQPDELQVARDVVAKINEHAGTAFRGVNDANQLTAEGEAIVARYRKGATSWEMRLIAWHKCSEFTEEDGIGRKFCKPSTLYALKHFDRYLDESAAAYAESESVPVDVARRGQERKGEQTPLAVMLKEVMS